MKVWPLAVEETDRQGKPFRNFSEIWDKFYSALWDKLLKFGRNYSGLWERFRDSEIQKLLRNYSEIIQKLFQKI